MGECISCLDRNRSHLESLRRAVKKVDKLRAKARINENDYITIRMPMLVAGLFLRIHEHLCTCQNSDTTETYELDLDTGTLREYIEPSEANLSTHSVN